MTSDLESCALKGDVEAFDELIRAWDHDLRSVVWAVVRSAHATDDVMQDSYEQAFRNIARFDGQASLKTWLHTVCLRGAIDYTRSESVRRHDDVDDESSSAELGQTFDGLDGVDQMLLMLTAGLGYSFEEAATIAGLERGTVASRVAGARHQLRSRHPLTDDRQADDLHEHLQSRIPAPGRGYWDAIDERLHAIEGRGDAQGPEEVSDTDSSVVDLASIDTPDDRTTSAAGKPAAWFENKNLLAAAALLVIAGIAAFALPNNSSDLIEAATTAQATERAEGAIAAADEPAIGGEGALTAVQSRLAGQAAGSAGPFCFTADDVYDFESSEVDDLRDLFWMDITFDGFVSFFALQGDTVLVSGNGYPSESGTLVAEPYAVGVTQLPPSYTIVITDSDVSLASVEAALASTPCAQVQDRIETMFALVQGATTAPAAPIVPTGLAAAVSADWPPSDAVLSSSGLGPIRIGMTVSELSEVVGAELTFDTFGVRQAGECGTVASNSAISNDVWILIELTSATDAVIRRVSVSGGSWTTPSGILIGVTEQTVLDTFPGQIVSEPHVFVDGTYMNYQPASDSDPNTVQFVNEGGTIAQIHVGDRAWVGLVEGCA